MAAQIYCPKCSFEPPASMRWICRPGCGHRWNTFATHGICPGCKKMWHETKCPRCKMWSPHDDWYHADGLVDAREIKVNREREVEKSN